MRDSAGFAPDFAVFAPAGDMCPATRAYAITATAVIGLGRCSLQTCFPEIDAIAAHRPDPRDRDRGPPAPDASALLLYLFTRA